MGLPGMEAPTLCQSHYCGLIPLRRMGCDTTTPLVQIALYHSYFEYLSIEERCQVSREIVRIKEISELITGVTSDKEIISVINALFIHGVYQKIVMKVSRKGHKRVLPLLAILPLEEKRQIITLALPFLVAQMTAHEKIDLLRAIAAIPLAERSHVLYWSLQLKPQHTEYLKIDALIWAIMETPHCDRESAATLALTIIPEQLTGEERGAIVKTLAKIPMEDRLDVISHVLQLSNGMADCYSNRTLLMEEVARVSKADREHVTQFVRQLVIPGMNGIVIASLFSAIATLPAHEREQVVSLARQMILPGMTGCEIKIIFCSVASVAMADRKVVVDCTQQITEGIHRDVCALSEVMGALAEIPPQKRGVVVHTVIERICSEMSIQERLEILKSSP